MNDKESIELLQQRIKAARRQIPCDLVFKKGRVVNVFSGEILERDVAVHQGVIVGVGEGYTGEQEVDVRGRFIAPGLIDGHMHIESTMLLPSRLAASLLVHGTTAIVSDPHEIANVMGVEGIRFMLRESEALPFDFFFMVRGVEPYHAQILNKMRFGDMLIAGESLFVLEVEPAGYVAFAINEALKAARVKLIDASLFGAFGRVYLSGSEAEIDAAAEAAQRAIEGIAAR